MRNIEVEILLAASNNQYRNIRDTGLNPDGENDPTPLTGVLIWEYLQVIFG